METSNFLYKNIENNDETDIIFENLCYGDIIYLRKNFQDMLQDIEVAVELDNRKVFLEGLVNKLNEFGCDLDISDSEGIIKELKVRYKNRMGIAIPRTVKEWIRGTTPGTVNRRNNYELCYALEMDVNETAEFFIKNYLSVPYNYKDSVDAIFYYGLLNNKGYDKINFFLERAKEFTVSETVATDTIEIGRNISEIDDDKEFLLYISRHYVRYRQKC